MRIIGGSFGGRRLAALGKGDAAAHLRPTTDRLRESIFNMLSGGAFGDPLPGARVLDLFAGTGALGLEALSRGASMACFVDDGRKALGLLRRNLEICHVEEAATILRRNATHLGPNPAPPYGLIFLDPPYGKGLGEKALAAAREGGWIAPDALIVLEEAAPVAPEGFAVLEQRRHGESWISFLRPAPGAAHSQVG